MYQYFHVCFPVLKLLPLGGTSASRKGTGFELAGRGLLFVVGVFDSLSSGELVLIKADMEKLPLEQ